MIQQAAEQVSRRLDVSLMNIPGAVGNLSRQVKDLKKQLSTGRAPASQTEESTGSKGGGNQKPSYFDIRDVMRETARRLNVPILEVAQRVEALAGEIQSLRDQLEKLNAASNVDADELIAKGELVGDICVIAKEVPGANPDLMVRLIDQVRKKKNPVAVMFATSPAAGKVLLSAGFSRDLVEQGWNAGDWIGAVAPVVGGRGGGKPDLAKAGGKNPEKIDEAVHAAIEFIKTKHMA